MLPASGSTPIGKEGEQTVKYEHWQIPAVPEQAVKALTDAGIPLSRFIGAGRARRHHERAGRRSAGARADALLLSVFDEGHGQGRRAHLARAGGGRKARGLWRLRRGRHHLHLPSDRLSPLARGGCDDAHPPPHRGGLRPRLRRHPRAFRVRRDADRHGRLRHHGRGRDGLRRDARRRSCHHRPPRVQGAAPRRRGRR